MLACRCPTSIVWLSQADVSQPVAQLAGSGLRGDPVPGAQHAAGSAAAAAAAGSQAANARHRTADGGGVAGAAVAAGRQDVEAAVAAERKEAEQQRQQLCDEMLAALRQLQAEAQDLARQTHAAACTRGDLRWHDQRGAMKT